MGGYVYIMAVLRDNKKLPPLFPNSLQLLIHLGDVVTATTNNDVSNALTGVSTRHLLNGQLLVIHRIISCIAVYNVIYDVMQTSLVNVHTALASSPSSHAMLQEATFVLMCSLNGKRVLRRLYHMAIYLSSIT